jgi:hypothetical protein
MLDLIQRVKAEKRVKVFDARCLNNTLRHLENISFLHARSQNKFRDDVELRVITDSDNLEEVAIKADSCLHKKSGREQTAAFERFLSDPGAIYISIKDEWHTGYVCVYAAKTLEGGQQILFEDGLLTKPNHRNSRNEVFQPKFKSVVLHLFSWLNVVNSAYVFSPDEIFETGWGTTTYRTPLRIHKLGSDFYKKGRVPCFYNNRFDLNETIWPEYTRAIDLLG